MEMATRLDYTQARSPKPGSGESVYQPYYVPHRVRILLEVAGQMAAVHPDIARSHQKARRQLPLHDQIPVVDRRSLPSQLRRIEAQVQVTRVEPRIRWRR